MSSDAHTLNRILELARWAPSGDNTQPWRFEVTSDTQFVVHGRDTRADCVYDLDGRASQLSLGALLETIDIAASGFGLATQISRRAAMPETNPTFDVQLAAAPDRPRSPLLAAIPARSVNRGRYQMRPLAAEQWAALESAVGPDHRLIHAERFSDRLAWARMLWANAGLRLTLPEAFEVHKRVIEWNARFSPDRIPDQALGASLLTRQVMRNAMASWSRVAFLNKWFGGTLGPRIEMDWLPALACGAHIAIIANRPPVTVDDHVAAGRAVQRFWLTATKLGLQHQPAVTPVVFSRYAREGLRFAEQPSLQARAASIGASLTTLLDEAGARAVWLGRLGQAPKPAARSLRKTPPELRDTAPITPAAVPAGGKR